MCVTTGHYYATAPNLLSAQTHKQGHYWVNIAAYQMDDMQDGNTPIPFSKRVEENRKLAVACARRSVLAFASGFVTDSELYLDPESDLEDDEFVDYEPVRQKIMSFNATQRGITHGNPDRMIPGLKRLRERLANMSLGANVVVYVPSKVGLLGIATVTETVHTGSEIPGFPGFTTQVGVKWLMGPYYAGSETRCLQIPDVQGYTKQLGVRINRPVQYMNFAQYSEIFKLVA